MIDLNAFVQMNWYPFTHTSAEEFIQMYSVPTLRKTTTKQVVVVFNNFNFKIFYLNSMEKTFKVE